MENANQSTRAESSSVVSEDRMGGWGEQERAIIDHCFDCGDRFLRVWWWFVHAQSCPTLTPWTIAHQAPLSMGFSSQEYWSGLPFPPPYHSSLPTNLGALKTSISRSVAFYIVGFSWWPSQVVLVVKNLFANAGEVWDAGSIPGLGRSPGGGHSSSEFSSILIWRIPWIESHPSSVAGWSSWGCKEWDTAEAT